MDEMDRYREDAYSALLASADSVLQDMRNQERLRPPSFNIFFALGHAYRELSTHSAMLAHLLDPAGGHAQGSLFLRKFLEIIQRASERQGKRLDITPPADASRWQCRKEVSLPRGFGQADIVLRGPNLLIVVENKVGAGDQDSQLRRYWEFANIEAQSKRLLPIIIYLTPDGRAPTVQSTGGSREIEDAAVRLSYHEDIYEFIQSSAEASEAVSVAEVLRQYATLVRGLV